VVRPGGWGAITILHSLFFGSKVVWLHGLSVASLTTVVVLILFASYQLQAPFAGSVRIEPEAFEEVLDDIQRQAMRLPAEDLVDRPWAAHTQRSEFLFTA
jgi:hypothetical protein